MVIDLYLSVRNPFGKPDSHVTKMHLTIVSVVVFLAIILLLTENYGYREDMQICFIRTVGVRSHDINWVAAGTIYIPGAVLIAMAIFINCLTGRRLHKGLPDTFNLRMYVLLFLVFVFVFCF